MKQALKSIYAKIPFKQPVFSVLRHLPVPHCVYKHLHFQGEILVTVEPGKTFRINHYGYSDENELFWVGIEGCWEKVSLEYWKRIAKRSQVIFDAGANNGIFSLVAKTVNPSAKVYSFEPVVRICEKLKRNSEINSFDIRAFQYAVSDEDGEVTMHVPRSEHAYGASVISSHLKDCAAGTAPQLTPMRRLATVIKEEKLPRLDLVKIDVELLEPQVLRGLGEYLERYRPSILIEVLNDEIGAEVEALVSGLGYLFYDTDEVRAPWLTRHIKKSSHLNYLLCQPDVAAQIGLEVPART